MVLRILRQTERRRGPAYTFEARIRCPCVPAVLSSMSTYYLAWLVCVQGGPESARGGS